MRGLDGVISLFVSPLTSFLSVESVASMAPSLALVPPNSAIRAEKVWPEVIRSYESQFSIVYYWLWTYGVSALFDNLSVI